MQLAPLLEKEVHLIELLLGKRHVLPAGLIGRSVEVLRISQGVDEVCKVWRSDVRHEPGDRLGMEDDCRRKARREKVPGEDKVNKQLETRVIEHDIHPPFLVLLFLLCLLKDIECSVHIVDEDVLLCCFTSMGALQLLEVLVGKRSQQGQVCRISPQTDLTHLRKY